MNKKEENSTLQIFLHSGNWKRILLIGMLSLLVVILALPFLAFFLSQYLLSHQVDMSKLNSVTIVVNRVSDGPPVKSVAIFQKTISDPQKVQQIYQEITSLHQVKGNENYNCPAGLPTYNVFKMSFFQQGKLIVQATNSVTGCPFWVVKVASNGNSSQYCCTPDALWSQWHQEFGLPTPYPPIKQGVIESDPYTLAAM